MFAQRISRYINDGMKRNGFTYEDLHQLCGVPVSTLHNWAHGRVTRPNDDNLIRIARAFGDPPEVVESMRLESLAATAEADAIIAQAHDMALMEKFAELINANTSDLFEQFRLDSDARYAARLKTVHEQYDRLYARQDHTYAERLAQQHEQDQAAYDRSTLYLKAQIRYYRRLLSAALCLCLLCLILLGSYSLYAYRTFDRADPEHGMYRRTESFSPSEDDA